MITIKNIIKIMNMILKIIQILKKDGFIFTKNNDEDED